MPGSSWPTSSCRTGWREKGMTMGYADDSVLVLLDVTPTGELAKSAPGLLGAAASVGTPVALIAGPGAASLADAAGGLGAAQVLVAEAHSDSLIVPVVDALTAAAALVRPDAVLASH